MQRRLKGPYSHFFYWYDISGNLWTHVKSKNNWDDCSAFFAVLFIESELFRKTGKIRSAVNKSAGERFNLQSQYSYQLMRKCLLYKIRESFFSNFIFVLSKFVFKKQRNFLRRNVQLLEVVFFCKCKM